MLSPVSRRRVSRARRKRRSVLEQLERRDLLAADYRNPVDAFDVNADQRISALDALVVINDLGRHGVRTIEPANAPARGFFVDVTGEGDASALDALRVINALGRGIRSPYVLTEGNAPSSDSSITIGLGEAAGTRTYRLHIDAELDTSDASSSLEDTFAIYLVDPSSGQTLIDRGTPGTSLFTLSGTAADYVPGQVRFDGENVEIDVTTTPSDNAGLLVLQLINTDGDTGSVVTVTPLSNVVNSQRVPGPQLQSNSLASQPGESSAVALLTETSVVRPVYTNIRYDSENDLFTAELSLLNEGETTGRNLVVVFDDLASEDLQSMTSGMTSLGAPYLNFRPAIPPGGLVRGATSAAIELVVRGSSRNPLSLSTSVFAGDRNRPPVLNPVSPITIHPGNQIELQLAASDPDGDPIRYSVTTDGEAPTSRVTGGGTFVLAPTPDELGQYTLHVNASDGSATSSESLSISVEADPIGTTRISGMVLDTLSNPLVDVPIELGAANTRTAADGSFQIEFSGSAPSDTLFVRGEAIGGAETFPFIAEKLPLLFGHELYLGFDNVILRPIYLPALDLAQGEMIDPEADVLVTANLRSGEPAAEVLVAAGSLNTPGGQPFSGVLSITEVPAEFTPAALPAEAQPDVVVTIQPGEMIFNLPAPLNLPNRAGLSAGTLLDLFSINPQTGDFDRVGKGRVSTDGEMIRTISGGVRNSSWHYFVPEPPKTEDPDKNPRNKKKGCNVCVKRIRVSEIEIERFEEPIQIAFPPPHVGLVPEFDPFTFPPLAPATGEVDAHSGSMHKSHMVSAYQAGGRTNLIPLVFSGDRANAQPLIHFGVENVAADPEMRLVASLEIERGGVKESTPGVPPGQIAGAPPDAHFWSVAQAGTARAALPIDMTSRPSGLYTVHQHVGVGRLFSGDTTDAAFAGRIDSKTQPLIHVNAIDSPFGAGWTLGNMSWIVTNPNGSLLIVDGDGTEQLYDPPPSDGEPYRGQPGDFSVVRELPGGGWSRTFTDQTVELYDVEGRLNSVIEADGQTTNYNYDQGQLESIVDSVGGTILIEFENGMVRAIIDPAGRRTVLSHDDNGDLISIEDPDGVVRRMEFDSLHRMVVDEIAPGTTQRFRYDAQSQLRSVDTNGSVRRFQAGQHLRGFAPGATLDPANPPTADSDSDFLASFADENGDVRQIGLTASGQVTGGLDAIGPGTSVSYINEQPETLIDASGDATFVGYDDRGNRTYVIDSLDLPNIIADTLAVGESVVYEFVARGTTGLNVDVLGEGTDDPSNTLLSLQRRFGDQWLTAESWSLDEIDRDLFTADEVLAPIADGSYRVVISGVGDFAGGYALRIRSMKAGLPIFPGRQVSGVLAENSGNALFTFEGESGEQVFVTSGLQGGSPGGFHSLIDPNGNLLERLPLNRDIGSISLPADGIYTVVVAGAVNVSVETDYDFTVWPVSATAVPIELNETVTGFLDHRGQMNRFDLEIPGETVVIIDPLTVDPQVTVRMRGPAGDVIDEQLFFNMENGGSVYQLQPGTYEILLESLAGEASYGFRVLNAADGTVIADGQSVAGGNEDGRGTTVYQLDAVAGGSYDIALVSRTRLDPPNTRVKVFDAYANPLLDVPLSGLDNEFTAQHAGPVSILFEGPNNATSPDFWVFDIELAGTTPPPPAGAVPLVIGQPLTATPSLSTPFLGELELTDRALLQLDFLDTADPNARVTLTGPTGPRIDNVLVRFASSEPLLNLPAGSYFLEIFGDGDVDLQFLSLDDNLPAIVPSASDRNVTLDSEEIQIFQIVLGDEASLFAESNGFPAAGNWSLSNDAGLLFASDTLGDDLDIGPLASGQYFLILENFSDSPHDFTYNVNVQETRQFDVELGDQLAGDLLVPGSVDFYNFTVDEPTVAHVSCSNDSDAVFSITGPIGEQFDSVPTGTCSLDQSDLSDQTVLFPEGTYFVRVESPLGRSGSYEINITDLSDSNAIGDGTFSSTLDAGEIDYYSFTLTDYKSVTVESQGNDNSVYYELFAADGADLNPRRSFRGDADLVDENLNLFSEIEDGLAPGNYYIAVQNFAGSTSYAFDLVIDADEDFDATFDTEFSGSIDRSGEADIYRFPSQQDGLYFLNVTTPRNSDLSYSYSCGSQILAEGNFATHDYLRGLIDSPGCGAEFSVRGTDVDDEGDYAFELQDPYAGSLVIDGEIISGQLDESDDADWYTFDVEAGDVVTFEALTLDNADRNPHWTAYDCEGRQIFETEFSESPSADVGPFTVTCDGKMAVGFIGDNNSTQAASFSFLVDIESGVPPVDESTLIAIGESLVGTIDAQNPQDLYRVLIDSFVLVSVDAIENDDSLQYRIEGPRGTVIPERSFSRADTEVDVLTLTSGTYFITVDGVGSGTGDYHLELDLLEPICDGGRCDSGNLGGQLVELQVVSPGPLPITPGETVSGELNPGSESDTFAFGVTAEQLEQGFFFDSLDASSDARIRFVDPFGTTLHSGLVRDDVPHLPITRTGTHYVLIEGRPGRSPSSYSFDLLALATPLVEPITFAEQLGTRVEYDDTFSRPTRITSSTGRVTDFEIDPATGNVMRIIRRGDDGQDSTRAFTYNSDGLVLTATDGEGRVTAFTYDALGRTASVTEAPGTSIEAITTFDYDDAGNNILTVNPRGGQTIRQFDDLNRLTRLVQPDPDGVGFDPSPVSEFVYDDAGNVTIIRDPLLREVEFVYDTRNRLTESIDPLGHSTRFEYDAAGNNVRIRDARGNTSHFEYDDRGRLTASTNALGQRTEFRYDQEDRLVESVNPLADTTRFDYDARDRLVRAIDPLGNINSSEYDRDNRVIAAVDANGNTTRLEYDALGRLVRAVDAIGNVNRIAYDASDLPTTSTNAAGQTTTTEYDERARAVLIRDALGGEQGFNYDQNGNLTSANDELGAITSYEYDLLDRLIRRSDPDPDGAGPLPSPQTTYSYDLVGNLLSRTDAVGNVTRYFYDDLNRVATETDPRDRSRNYRYDPVGNLELLTDRNGRLTGYAYDALNRKTSESWFGDGGSIVNQFNDTYDAAGRLTSSSDNDSRLSWSYDAAGRALSASNAGTDSVPDVTLTYNYDPAGNVTRRTEMIAGIAAGQTQYQYDARNRVARITQSAAPGSVDPVAAKRVDLFYNELGQFDRIDRFADLDGQSPVAASHYTYDGLSRLRSLTHTGSGSATLASYDYEYDPLSRITQITDVDGTSKYSYDALSRLLAADHSNPLRDDESYAYDAAGNRTASHLHGGDYVNETGNRLTDDGTYSYEYDDEGNLVQRTDTVSGEIRELDYDHRNRLVRVTDRVSVGGVITVETEYRYDALNRRMAKLHDADGDGVQEPSAEYYFHHGNQIVLEIVDTDGPVGVNVPVLVRRNLYGPGIDFLLATEHPQQTQIRWIFVDHQNTTRDIINSDGSARNHLIYDAYGNLVSESAAELTTRFLYTGREFDSATGLYYYRERYYDATLGRFVNEDPIGFAGGDNLFSYVGGNPVNDTDPFGLYAYRSARSPEQIQRADERREQIEAARDKRLRSQPEFTPITLERRFERERLEAPGRGAVLLVDFFATTLFRDELIRDSNIAIDENRLISFVDFIRTRDRGFFLRNPTTEEKYLLNAFARTRGFRIPHPELEPTVLNDERFGPVRNPSKCPVPDSESDRGKSADDGLDSAVDDSDGVVVLA